MKSKKPATWSNVKASLSSMDRAGLVGVIRDLYEASAANRRFLHARFVPAAATLDEYRDLVEKAVFPDPLSQRPIRLRDAAATITDYKRSTGDLAGVVDLLLTFVEAGTEQAADLGYGDDAYFFDVGTTAHCRRVAARRVAGPDAWQSAGSSHSTRGIPGQDRMGVR